MGHAIVSSDLAGVFAAHERYAILSHTRPDGDALGSQMAMKAVLESMGKEARAFNDDGVPESLRFLEGAAGIEDPSGREAAEAEVILALDTANRSRLGENSLAAVEGAGRLWVNIDHHISNEGYGDLFLVDPGAAATGEILYHVIRELDLPLPPAARDALYVAVSTDTGSFQYANTTAGTHEMAADLVRRGADVGAITTALYHDYPFRRVELLRALLETLQRSDDGWMAWWTLPMATKERLGVMPGDGEGLIDIMRAIRGVVVCAFFEELEDGRVRVSMRSTSREADVCKVCAAFGGGGHPMAAGARLDGPLDEAVRRLVGTVRVVSESPAEHR